MKLTAYLKTLQSSLLGYPGGPQSLGQSPFGSLYTESLSPKKGKRKKGSNLSFSNFLGSNFLGVSGAVNGGVQNALFSPPTPPTPPSDLQNTAAVSQYHQDLLAYNQKFQTYHLQMIRLMTQRLEQLQTTLQASKNKSSSTIERGTPGTGGILDPLDLS